MDWLAIDKKFVLNLLNVMARAESPVRLTIGHAFDLSLDTFAKVSIVKRQLLKNWIEFTKFCEIESQHTSYPFSLSK